MKLKCIGGECDGRIIEVDENKFVSDYIRISELNKIQFVDLTDLPPQDIAEATTVKYHVYRIAVFNFDRHDKYKFLVPNGWTDKEAILFQFHK